MKLLLERGADVDAEDAVGSRSPRSPPLSHCLTATRRRPGTNNELCCGSRRAGPPPSRGLVASSIQRVERLSLRTPPPSDPYRTATPRSTSLRGLGTWRCARPCWRSPTWMLRTAMATHQRGWRSRLARLSAGRCCCAAERRMSISPVRCATLPRLLSQLLHAITPALERIFRVHQSPVLRAHCRSQNPQNGRGYLHQAAGEGRTADVELLLSLGAKPDILDRVSGQSADDRPSTTGQPHP